MRHLNTLAKVILFSVCTPLAQAGLLVDKSIVVFDDITQMKEDISVINDDEEKRLFVEVVGYSVESPGTEAEELVPLARLEEPTFVATRNKLIVQPGSSSVVRLLNLQPATETDAVYRINFLPISKPLELVENDDEESVKPVLEILVAYQILAIVLPVNPKVVTSAKRTGKKAVFSNEGNTNYLMTNGQQCNPADKNECEELPSKRIYAGNTWSITLPYDGPFTFSVRSFAGNKVLVVE
jgi:hypothetical protein